MITEMSIIESVTDGSNFDTTSITEYGWLANDDVMKWKHFPRC